MDNASNSVGAEQFRAAVLRGALRRLHRNEDGTISIATVIALLMFTMIMGMVINVGQQLDDKMKLQNAADAATYSGGVVIARGMNAIAFTNHLLSEVFALTAYMREGEARRAESLTPEILAAWEEAGRQFQGAAGFQKFLDLAPAIAAKVPLERELIAAFGEMTAIKAEVTLPVFEYILGNPETNGGGATTHLIPEFQRAVVRTVPSIAQLTMDEIAGRHGTAQASGSRSQDLAGVLWRTRVMPVGYPDENDPTIRTLPALDPSPEGTDMAAVTPDQQADAVRRREDLARHYLEQWISDSTFDLAPFEREGFSEGGRVSGKMSQFINLWRNFTCAELRRLLDEEFPTTNLPHVIRSSPSTPGFDLDDDFMFVGVVYWPQKPQFFPGMFRSPIQGDAMAYSQVMLYLPRPRYLCCPWQAPYYDWRGRYLGVRTQTDNWPTSWDLFSQNWTVRMVPATTDNLASILQTPPGNVVSSQVQLPNLGGLTTEQINTLSPH